MSDFPHKLQDYFEMTVLAHSFKDHQIEAWWGIQVESGETYFGKSMNKQMRTYGREQTVLIRDLSSHSNRIRHDNHEERWYVGYSDDQSVY